VTHFFSRSLRVPPNDSVSIHLDHRVQISSISLADGSEEKAFPNSLPFELGVNQLYVQYLEKPDRTLSALVCALSISHVRNDATTGRCLLFFMAAIYITELDLA